MSKGSFLGCPGGYWSAVGGHVATDCIPVGEGFFSPVNNSSRFACLPGTFSNVKSADACVPCSPGSYVDKEQASNCVFCPQGSYSQTTGSHECLPCDDLYYSGLASDFAISLPPEQTGLEYEALFCLEPLDGGVYAPPTIYPTSAPTVSPSGSASTSATSSPTTPETAVLSSAPSPWWTNRPSTTSVPTAEQSLNLHSIAPSAVGTTYPDGAVVSNPDVPGYDNDETRTADSLSQYWLPAMLAVFLAIAVGLAVIWFFPTGDDDASAWDESRKDDNPMHIAPSSLSSHNQMDCRESVTNLFFDYEEDSLESVSAPSLSKLPVHSRPDCQESVSNIFIDGEEDAAGNIDALSLSKQTPPWRDTEIGNAASGSASEAWSMSIGLGDVHGYGSEEESNSSADLFSL